MWDAEVYDRLADRKNNGMSPPGVSRIDMHTISSTFTDSQGVTKSMKVDGAFKFVCLKEVRVVLFD